MDALHFEYMPTLRQPYLLMTYGGWSDAAEVATAAGHFLVQHLQAERFAWIDAEEFFSFTDQRPQSRYNEQGEREITWPGNEFFVSHQPTLEHDIIIAVGIEPHLKWRTFTSLVMEFIKRCDVYQTYTLGALWADVLYSHPCSFLAHRLIRSCLASGVGWWLASEVYHWHGGCVARTLRRQQFTSASIYKHAGIISRRGPIPAILAVAPWPADRPRRLCRRWRKRHGSLILAWLRPLPKTQNCPRQT